MSEEVGSEALLFKLSKILQDRAHKRENTKMTKIYSISDNWKWKYVIILWYKRNKTQNKQIIGILYLLYYVLHIL